MKTASDSPKELLGNLCVYLQYTGAILFGISTGVLMMLALLHAASGNNLSQTGATLGIEPLLFAVIGASAIAVGLKHQDRSEWKAWHRIAHVVSLASLAFAMSLGAALPIYTVVIVNDYEATKTDAATFTMVKTQLYQHYASPCAATLAMTDIWEPITIVGAVMKKVIYRDLFSHRQPNGGCLTAAGLFERMPAAVAIGEHELERTRWLYSKRYQASQERIVSKIGISPRDWCLMTSKEKDSVARQRECAAADDTTRLTAPPSTE